MTTPEITLPQLKHFRDVPIAIAMIAWNWMPPHGDGRIQVIPWPDTKGWCSRLKLSCTTGACFTGWCDLTEHDQLCRVLIESWGIVVRDKLPLESVHDALLMIPEYKCVADLGFSFPTLY